MPEIEKNESDLKNSEISIVAPEDALGCPNCGSVAGGTDLSSGSQCSYCSSELIPQEEAYTKTIAKRSSLPKTKSIIDYQKRFPILSELRGRVGSVINGFEYWTGKGKADDLAREGKIVQEQLPFAEKAFSDWLAQKSVFFKSILEMPDEDWSLCEGKNQVGQPAMGIFLPLAHPSGKYSIIRVAASKNMSSFSRGGSSDADYIYIETHRITKSPSSASVTNELFEKFDASLTGEAEEIFDADSAVGFDTKADRGSDAMHPELEARLFEFLGTLSNDSESASDQILNFLQSIPKSEWPKLVKSQEIYFAAKMKEKVDRVFSLNGGEINTFEEPELSEPDAAGVDERYHLDSVYNQGLSAETGVSISCSHCGYPIKGYEGKKSFFSCPSCSMVNDIVKTKRLSKEVLRNREKGDLLVPSEYFLSLLFSANEGLGSNFLDILQRQEVSDEDRDVVELTLASSFLSVMQDNPHLVQYLDYRYEDYGNTKLQRGFVLFIDFGDQSQQHVHKDGGVEAINLPEELRGKVLAVRVGDHDRPSFSGTDYEWYRMQSSVMSKAELEEAQTPEKFEEFFAPYFALDEVPENPHWLDRFFDEGTSGGTIIGSEINYDTDTPLERISGKLWAMMRNIFRSIPPGNEIDDASF